VDPGERSLPCWRRPAPMAGIAGVLVVGPNLLFA